MFNKVHKTLINNYFGNIYILKCSKHLWNLWMMSLFDIVNNISSEWDDSIFEILVNMWVSLWVGYGWVRTFLLILCFLTLFTKLLFPSFTLVAYCYWWVLYVIFWIALSTLWLKSKPRYLGIWRRKVRAILFKMWCVNRITFLMHPHTTLKHIFFCHNGCAHHTTMEEALSYLNTYGFGCAKIIMLFFIDILFCHKVTCWVILFHV